MQEAPYGLQYTGYTALERGEAVYQTVLGEPTAITVTVDKGTDVMFDFDMGDGRQYVDQGTKKTTKKTKQNKSKKTNKQEKETNKKNYQICMLLCEILCELVPYPFVVSG